MFSSISSFSQNWEIISFKADPTDLRAKTSGRIDDNEKPCALLKISIDSNNVEFSGEMIKGDVKKEGGYWLVYVPEGTRYLTVIVNNSPTKLDFRKKNIDPQGLLTYIMNLGPNRKPANFKALAMSIVPGVGLMQKGRAVEGVSYLIGDVALIGGGIGLNIYGNNQKKIMNDRNTTLDAYKKAKNNYDSAKTGSYICYGTAAGVYVLNLVRSYVARPKPGAALQWGLTTETVPNMLIPGLNNQTFNISLCYTF